MGFFLFLGRVFFASLIIVSAWQMFNGFGVDGGPAAKEWSLKLNLAKANLSYRLWVNLPNIEVRQGSVTVVSLIAIGGVIFVIRKIFGAYLVRLPSCSSHVYKKTDSKLDTCLNFELFLGCFSAGSEIFVVQYEIKK
ncbi:uncharacterized protein LOC108827233 [Raphanus sativus]|uniref:Uncharacterized protein LOC108827233 n=1 Tax=Raphanus sativus TaxID=3726 RepID=A0A6J0L797_RAPSA|nr:uncharacterized protein LOC108827233 [Raphanus sativus]